MKDRKPGGSAPDPECDACMRRERLQARMRRHFESAYEDAEAAVAEIRAGRYRPRVIVERHE